MSLSKRILRLGSLTEPQNPTLSLSHQKTETLKVRNLPPIEAEFELIQVVPQVSGIYMLEHPIDTPLDY